MCVLKHQCKPHQLFPYTGLALFKNQLANRLNTWVVAGFTDEQQLSQPVSLTSVLDKFMKQNFLKDVSKYIEDRELNTWLHYLIDLAAFYGEATTSAYKGRFMDVIYQNFCKAFNAALPDILTCKLQKCGFFIVQNC